MSPSLSESKSASSKTLSYQELDILHALRGFCALYVVIFHAKFILWSGGTEYLKMFPRASWSPMQYLAFIADMLSSAGYEMVIFFFVLSGFFIRYAQVKKYRPTLRFYLNRIVRIYPSYLASLVLGGIILVYLAEAHPALLTVALGRELNANLLGAWHELHPFTFRALARAAVFHKVGEQYFGLNNVYWSLLPEALFYLSVPLAFWKPRYYYVLSAACYVLGLVAAKIGIDVGFFVGFAFYYNAYFALGVGLYDLVVTSPRWVQTFRRGNGMMLAAVLVFLLLALVVAAALHLRLLSGPLASLLAVLSVLVLLAGRVNRQNLLIRFFHEIGIFSFSLYLYHFPLLLLSYAGLVAITGNPINYARYYWLAIPLVTAASFALYYVTERVVVRFFRGT